MSIKKTLTLLALTLVCPGLHAHYKNSYNPDSLTSLIDAHNIYLSTSYLIGRQNDFEFIFKNAGDTFSFQPNFQEAHGFRASIGYIMGSWRLELEYLLQRSKIKGGTTRDSSSTAEIENNDNIRGDFRQHAFMINLYYTYALNNAFSTYFGAGIGPTHQRYTREPFNQALVTNPDRFRNSVTTLAYQFLTGLELHLSDHWSVFLGYRFLVSLRAIKEDSTLFLFGPERTDDFPYSHSLETGIRLRF